MVGLDAGLWFQAKLPHIRTSVAGKSDARSVVQAVCPDRKDAELVEARSLILVHCRRISLFVLGYNSDDGALCSLTFLAHSSIPPKVCPASF